MRCESTIVKLKDLCIGGKGKYGIPASAVPYNENLYTYLRITDITDDGRINKSGLVSVDDEKASECLLQPNDIVFARTGGSTGRNYFYDGTDGEFVYAGFLIKFSIDPNRVNPRYVKYYCQSKQYRDWVNSFNTGSTRGNINAQTYAGMEFPLPNRKQQDLLVDTLSALDDKIELNNKINENLEQQAESIFKAWFVDCIPFGNEVPHTWKMVTLNDLTKLISRGIAPKYTENSHEWVINQKCIRNHMVDTSLARKHVPKAVNEKWLRYGDLLINSTGEGTLGRTAQIWFDPEHLTVDSHVTIVRPAKENLIYYIGFWGLQHEREIEALHTGSTGQTELPRERVKAMQLYRPDEETLCHFTEIIAPLTAAIVVNQKENEKLATTRDVLLPKLMSGEIDASTLRV